MTLYIEKPPDGQRLIEFVALLAEHERNREIRICKRSTLYQHAFKRMRDFSDGKEVPRTQDRPPDSFVAQLHYITFDSDALESLFFNQYNGLYTRHQRETIVNTMYKWKDRKILLLNHHHHRSIRVRILKNTSYFRNP